MADQAVKENKREPRATYQPEGERGVSKDEKSRRGNGEKGKIGGDQAAAHGREEAGELANEHHIHPRHAKPRKQGGRRNRECQAERIKWEGHEQQAKPGDLEAKSHAQDIEGNEMLAKKGGQPAVASLYRRPPKRRVTDNHGL